MKLPTYSSTALPQKATISPNEAAAAAATKYQFGAQVAGQIGEFAIKMYEAEESQKAATAVGLVEAAANDRLSDARYEAMLAPSGRKVGTGIKNFMGDEIMQDEEVDVDKLILDDYAEFEKQAMSATSGITLKSQRAAAEQRIQSILSETKVQLANKANKIRVRRMEITARDRGFMLEQQGQYGAAREVYREAANQLIFSPEQLSSLIEHNEKLEREEPYSLALLSNDPDLIESAMVEAYADQSLGEDRVQWIKELRGHRDAVEAREDREQARRWKENEVEMWINLDELSPRAIAMIDVSPDAKETAIRLLRSEARADRRSGGRGDSPQAISRIDAALIAYLDDPSMDNYAFVQKTIGDETDDGTIGSDTALKKLKELGTMRDETDKGTDFNDVRSLAKNTIVGGFPAEAAYDYYKSVKGAKLYAMTVEVEEAMMSELRRANKAGEEFDAWQWWQDNKSDYVGRVTKIQEGAPTINELMGTYVNDTTFDYKGGLIEIEESGATGDQKARLKNNWQLKYQSWREENANE